MVPTCSCLTEIISSYLDKIMAVIVKTLPSYIKESRNALEIFHDFNFLGLSILSFPMAKVSRPSNTFFFINVLLRNLTPKLYIRNLQVR